MNKHGMKWAERRAPQEQSEKLPTKKNTEEERTFQESGRKFS